MTKLQLLYLLLSSMLVLNGCSNNHLQPGRLNEQYLDYDDITKPVTQDDILKARASLVKNSNSPQIRSIASRLEESFIIHQNHKGKIALKNNDLTTAKNIYNTLSELFPNRSFAKEGLKKVTQLEKILEDMELARSYLQQKNYNDARRIARKILINAPTFTSASQLLRRIETKEQSEKLSQSKIELGEKFNTIIDLNFRRVSIDKILQFISSSVDVNILFDQSVDGTKETSVFLKEKTIINTLELFAQANNLFLRPIDENTVILVNKESISNNNSPSSIASFQIVHANPEEIAALLSSFVKIEDTYIDETLNILVVNASPDKIALAQRLIALKDVPEPMVMLELEILEVSRSENVAKGLQHPNNILFSPESSGASINLDQFRNLSSGQFEISPIPYLGLQFSDESSSTKLLANPRMKILNNETGSINIGDRLPLVSAVTNNGVTSEKISFVNVGIILSFTPKILPNGEIILDINLEVSSAGDTIQTSTSTTYQIGTRSFTTKLRVRDGETQVLGGLLRDDDRNSYTGFPIFLTGKSNQRSQTEIILSITPRLFDHINFSKEDNDDLFKDFQISSQNNDEEDTTVDPSLENSDFTNESIEPSNNTSPSNIKFDLVGNNNSWDGFEPLPVTLYSDSNANEINSGIIIEFKRQKLFSNIDIIPLQNVEILEQKINLKKGTISLVIANIQKGKHPLVEIKAKPKFRVLEKVSFKIREAASQTHSGKTVVTKKGKKWEVTPK